jgi:hypothetical protein
VAGGEPSMFFEDEGEPESGSARPKQERNARSHA